MTARDITDHICRFHWSPLRKILIPNVQEWWEADLLCIHESDWCDEVEIKISKSDFRREFIAKSRKHRILQEGLPSRIRGGHFSFLDDWNNTKPHIIRRYWMAMPLALAESVIGDVPMYAGILAVSEGRYGAMQCQVLRQPKVLKNARKVTAAEKQKLLWKAYIRYWDMRIQHPGQLVL